MRTICKISPLGYFEGSLAVEDREGVPVGWIEVDPPIGVGPYYLHAGASWVETDVAPPVPPEPYIPIQISRIDFTRLFTGAQQASINALRKACGALTLADYADPSAGLLIQLEIVFQQFDLPAEFIELNHPDTRLGLELLAYAGVFGEDPSSALAEVERILAGIPLS